MNLFYTSIHPNSLATFKLALLDTCTCAKSKDTGARFAVDTKNNIPSFLDQVTTGYPGKELKQSGLTVIDGVKFGLQTQRTQNSLDPVVIAPYVTLDFLDKLAADFRVSDIFYVPHAQHELDTFLLRYPNATELV